MPKIMVVDDEPPIVEAISYNLKKEGYQVATAGDAEECLAQALKEPPDAVILDMMLPSGSGLEVCRQLRLQHGSMPVIFLTARAQESDRLKGFDVGADDYVTKPFSMKELIARLRAVLRRRALPAHSEPPLVPPTLPAAHTPNGDRDSTVVKLGDITIDRIRREVFRKAERVDLSRREFELLALLALHPGRVFERGTILDEIWGEESYVDQRTVDVHIRWLRQKIEEEPSRPLKLLTVRGIGYKFSDES
jgi:DNA-binding response OmpR family regulator